MTSFLVPNGHESRRYKRHTTSSVKVTPDRVALPHSPARAVCSALVQVNVRSRPEGSSALLSP